MQQAEINEQKELLGIMLQLLQVNRLYYQNRLSFPNFHKGQINYEL